MKTHQLTIWNILLTLTFLFCFLNVSAQTLKVSPDTKLITYDTIISFEGIPADKLFDKTKAWFVEYFRDAKEVIRGENNPDLIKGTFASSYAGTNKPMISDIVVRIREGAIKITINRFVDGGMSLESYGLKLDKVTLRPSFRNTFARITEMCNELATNLKGSIEKDNGF